MAILYSDVIDQAQVAYPDLTNEKGLVYAQQVLDELVAEIPGIRDTVETSISLTAGTREYALGTTYVARRIHTASYIESATSRKRLELVTKSELDVRVPDWLQMTDSSERGAPIYCYFTDAANAADAKSTRKIGFHPIPDTTTSSGYPIAELRVSTVKTVAAADDIPAAFHHGRVFTAGIKFKYAQDRGSVEEMARFRQEYADERLSLQIILQQASGTRLSVLPTYVANRSVV